MATKPPRPLPPKRLTIAQEVRDQMAELLVDEQKQLLVLAEQGARQVQTQQQVEKLLAIVAAQSAQLQAAVDAVAGQREETRELLAVVAAQGAEIRGLREGVDAVRDQLSRVEDALPDEAPLLQCDPDAAPSEYNAVAELLKSFSLVEDDDGVEPYLNARGFRVQKRDERGIPLVRAAWTVKNLRVNLGQ